MSNLVVGTIGYSAKLSSEQFDKLSAFIYAECGIKMPAIKKTMLESRLHKRLRLLNMGSFSEYLEYLYSDAGLTSELIHMIDVVTTNKTDFFRENAHFEFLKDVIVPEYLSTGNTKTIKIWSAGCSSGEEPYTTAMVMQESLQNQNLVDYTILGTDISTEILVKASRAIYSMDRVADIPLSMKKKYLLKSKDIVNPSVRIDPVLRKKVSFCRLNFVDDSYSDIQSGFDIIFCRNVLIYFDKPTQEKVVNNLCKKLVPGGYFFLGHSESLTGMDVPLIQIRPTIFRKTE